MDFGVPTARVDAVERQPSPEPPSWEIPSSAPLGYTPNDHEVAEDVDDRDHEELDLASDTSQPTSPAPAATPPRFPSPPPLDLPISRSDTPAAPVQVDDEDPEAAFAAALPRAAVDDMPKFDISGSQSRFEGFSDAADVSWSGAAALDTGANGWAPEPAVHVSSPRFDEREQVEDGWGAPRIAEETYATPAPEMDWEATQRRLQLQDRMMVSGAPVVLLMCSRSKT